MILWWVGNAVLAFVALPIALALAFRIIGSLRAVTAAARDIAVSIDVVSTSVPPVLTTLSTVAGQCRRLESVVSH